MLIQELFPSEEKFTFLVGAGCSIEFPSCLPAGKQMMDAIIQHVCAKEEIGKIQSLSKLRFERLVEILRDKLDPNLKIIDYYGLCNKPNRQHFFLAEMIKKQHFVITTNFDFLIEYALIQSGISPDKVVPVITEEDFKTYSDPYLLIGKDLYPVYKVHGSTRNIVTNEDTKKSLITTMQSFGSGNLNESVFQLEPFKRPLFMNISKNRVLVVIGYSGSDDFDIVPTLKLLPELKSVLWVDHRNTTENPIINEVTTDIPVAESDKVGQILHDIKKMTLNIKIYRIVGNTSVALSHIMDTTAPVSSEPFKEIAHIWLEKNVEKPDYFQQYDIPSIIYHDFNMVEDAARCVKIIQLKAEQEGNKTWQAIAFSKIGSLLKRRGKLKDSLEYFRQALVIDENRRPRAKALDLNNIGTVLDDLGKLDEALNSYNQALAISKKEGLPREIANYLNNIGFVTSKMGKFEEGLNYFNEALAIAKQQGDLIDQANFLTNIGYTLYYINQDVNESIQYYEEALEIYKKLGDQRNIAAGLCNLGSILANKGDMEQALRDLEKSLNIALKIEDYRQQARAQITLGSIYSNKGEIDKAFNYFEAADQNYEILEDPQGRAITIGKMADILIMMGQKQGALAFLEKSLSILEEIGLSNSPEAHQFRKTISFIKNKP